MENEYELFINDKVYDMAASSGAYTARRGLDRAQVANILEAFDSEYDPISAVKLTIAFIARQIGRREIPGDIGYRIINDLRNILKKFSGDELRNAARKYLYLFKWFFESNIRFEVNNFDEFIERVLSRYRR